LLADALGANEGLFSMEQTPRTFVDFDAGLNVINKRPLDLVHLSHYAMHDRNLERNALTRFRRQSAACLNHLSNAGSAEDWFDAAQALDSSAQNIGAWELSQTAGAAGRLRGAPHNGACGVLLRTLEAQISDANAYIAEILKDA
jgi:hypothetical protein